MQALRKIAEWGVIALAYWLVGAGTLSLVSPLSTFTAVWAPTGVSIALMYLLGYRIWPGIALGAAITIFQISHSWGTTLGSTVADVLEAFTATYLARRFQIPRNPFTRSEHLIKFVFIAGIVSTALGATIGITSGFLSGFYQATELPFVWFAWWIENAGGVLVVAPLILVWVLDWPVPQRPFWWVEAAVILLLLVLTAGIVFAGLVSLPVKNYPLEYLCIPLVIYSAMRTGPMGATLSIFVLSCICLYGTSRGFGPFYRDTLPETLHLTQLYIGTNALFTLLVSVMVQERKQTEEKLSRSNAELSHFAYLASHDLKEPLRNVSLYSQLLATKYKGKLDEDADQYVGFIISGTARMYSLIDSLLEYCRLGDGIEKRPTDSSQVVDQAVENMRSAISRTHAEIRRTRLPIVQSHPSLLVHVFQNLIDNALKYHGPRPPSVSITAHRRANTWLFVVADNGIGIESRYFQDIFKLFRRGSSYGHLPGTGVGLAICKKIVEEHGGEIWVESNPGNGSRFCFTIPTPTKSFYSSAA